MKLLSICEKCNLAGAFVMQILKSNMDLLQIFGVSESYQLPDAIMDALFSEERREQLEAIAKNSISGSSLRDTFQSESGDRKKLKQDFTPDCVCELVSKIMKPGNFLDMCAGTGALTNAAVATGHHEIYSQEFSERTVPFLLLNACLNNETGVIERCDCLRSQTFERYQITKEGRFGKPQKIDATVKNNRKFQNVIMNPPYSMSFPDFADFSFFGLKVPKTKADYGFVLRGLEALEDGGRLIAVLPHGVLFRGQKEALIRKWLIEKRMIRAVIGLPDKMFMNTDIPIFLLVLQAESEGILFIDASKNFEKKGKNNVMRPEDIQKVASIFDSPHDVERYARVASLKEIEENDFNLNIPRYVDTFIPKPLPDMDECLRDLEKINTEEYETVSSLIDMLKQLATDNREDRRVLDSEIAYMQQMKETRDFLRTAF